MFKFISKIILKLWGWKIEGTIPNFKKYIIIAAPHTSNWDLILLLLFKFNTGIKVNWFGKDTIFRKPFGGLMKWLGGIPIDRKSHHKTVDKFVDEFKKHNKLIILISPEGTRSKKKKWKTGFYYIAKIACIPIVLKYLNYKEKIIGIGPTFIPTENIHTDFKYFQDFYSDKIGKYPKKQSEIEI